MTDARRVEDPAEKRLIHFHHGTDQTSAKDLIQNGVNQLHAAVFNGSGEFWATTDHHRAAWFALSHPDSPPAACFEFDLSEAVLLELLRIDPPAALRHGDSDYEFLPASHADLNRHMTNRQMVPC